MNKGVTLVPYFLVAVAYLFVLRLETTAGSHEISPIPGEIIGWSFLGALLALHRPFGGATLSLGTAALVPAIDRLGPAQGALVSVLIFLLAEVGRSAVRRKIGDSYAGRQKMVQHLVPILAASLAVGSWRVLTFDGRLSGSWSGWVLWLVLFWLATFVLFSFWLRGRWPRLEQQSLALLRPLLLDCAGLWLGALVVTTAGLAGWSNVLPLLLVAAFLVAEAARNAVLRGFSDERVVGFEKLQQAHVRILTETSGMGEIAQQILIECRNVLPVSWFQFEQLAADGSRLGSWFAAPGLALREGLPQPPPRPEMLPGVHRRAEWRMIEKALVAEDEVVAVVRLWCDPRRIEPGAEDLWRSLVPQMASSVHRALLDREAKLDALTEVPVRRTLETRLQRAYVRSCEEGCSMAVIMCDIDFFKRVNDTYGHAAGDAALIQVARALESQRREKDLLCRYGGEEFTLLLEETSSEAALQLAERLRKAVEAIDLVFEEQSIPLTMSAGVAAFPQLHIKTGSELVLLADEALYEAKEVGRNCCLVNLGRGKFGDAQGRRLQTQQEVEVAQPPRIFG